MSETPTNKKSGKCEAEDYLKKFVDDFDRFFIDTCSLMHDKAETFFENLLPYLQASGKKIIVPTVVKEGELIKLTRDNDPHKVELANRALKLISRYKELGIVEVMGDQSDLETLADHVLASVAGRFCRKYNMMFITQDRKCARDIIKARRFESVTRGIKKVWVKSISSSGLPKNFLSPQEIGELDGGSEPFGKRTIANPRKELDSEFDEDIDAFRMCTQVTSLENDILHLQTDVSSGDDVVAILRNRERIVKLGEKIAGGGEGFIFETDTPYVAKVYKRDKITTHKFEKIKLMLRHDVKCAGVCYPLALLYTPKKEFIGYLMPKAKGIELQKSLFIRPLLESKFPHWSKIDSVDLCLTILKKLWYLHRHNIILGDINPNNILLTSPKDVYFVDTDSYQIEGFPCPVGTINYTAPEIQGRKFTSFLRTEGNERFAVATLLFMIMLPGKPPYSQLGGENPIENILRMDFSYPLAENTNKKTPDGPWRFVWSHLTYAIKRAFYQTFKKGEAHSSEGTRLSDEEWLALFREYRWILNKGTRDPMSAELFPSRFKSVTDSTYVNCRICGRTMPETMCRNGICESCLRAGETCICKRCRNQFIYTNFEKHILKRKRGNYCRSCWDWGHQVAQQGVCIDCKQRFDLTNFEVEFYNGNPELSIPKRCKICRKERKRERENNSCQHHAYSNARSSSSTSETSHSQDGGSGFCFLTTAVCEYAGKHDDCEELSILRQYRDNWLADQIGGKDVILDYYRRSPRIVNMLRKSPMYAEICNWMLADYIIPCVQFAREGNNFACYSRYKEMVESLEKMLLIRCNEARK